MSIGFAGIAFTDNVKAIQARMGSREAYARHERQTADEAQLGSHEIAFIEARDSFYLSTVSETGWPYVQHRGGPVGFLKVLDGRTIGYADFAGNRQYISAGNLAGDNRVALILMDYPQQTRLKILGRAQVIEEDHNPELLTRLDNPSYRAHVERGIVIRIEGFDWNCPKYITPRYTEEEVAQRFKEAASAAAVPALTSNARPQEPFGQGELTLTITGVRQLTPRIRSYEMRAEDWGDLPLAEAGAHLVVPVRLGDGSMLTRQYSLVTAPGDRNRYEIAVLRDNGGRGGSQALHDTWQVGVRIRVAAPINHFPLHTDSRPAVLIAGGIGITPIKAMALALKRRNVPLELHYAGRAPADMAYHSELAAEFPNNYFAYFSRLLEHRPLDVGEVLRRSADDAVFYVCGPTGLIQAVRSAANGLGIAPERVRHESFR